MNNIKAFYVKYKHGIPLIVYAMIYLSWFVWLEKNVTKGYRVIHMAVDAYIPFGEVFVIFHLLWVIYVAAGEHFFFF